MGGQRALIGAWEGRVSVVWPGIGMSPVLNPSENGYNSRAKGRSELSTISDRSTLEISLPGGATWNPIMPLNGPIPPKRDSDIRRAKADDTLNFLIPGAFSSGNLDYRIRVFDSAHPDHPGYTSGRVQDTLGFTAVEPLRVRGVGVRYTGKDSSGNPTDIAAPDVAALRGTLSFVQKNYPVGQIFITGFDVIDYDGDFTDESGDGCGSGGSTNKLRVNLRRAAALVAAASSAPIHHSAQVYVGSPAQHWSLGSTASRAPSAAGRRSDHSLSPHVRCPHTAGRSAAGGSVVSTPAELGDRR